MKIISPTAQQIELITKNFNPTKFNYNEKDSCTFDRDRPRHLMRIKEKVCTIRTGSD